MADEDDGLAHLLKFFKFVITFCLEENVSHRQSLVYDQDLRLNVDSHRKCQTHEHTAGISLARLVHIVTDVRKL